VSSPARRPVPRVNDQSGFCRLYTSPFALSRSRWPGCATDKNSWLRSTKLFSHWSVSVEQSAAGNQDDITDTRTVLWPTENWNVSLQLLRISIAFIISTIRLRETNSVAELNWTRYSSLQSWRQCVNSTVCCDDSLHSGGSTGWVRYSVYSGATVDVDVAARSWSNGEVAAAATRRTGQRNCYDTVWGYVFNALIIKLITSY